MPSNFSPIVVCVVADVVGALLLAAIVGMSFGNNNHRVENTTFSSRNNIHIYFRFSGVKLPNHFSISTVPGTGITNTGT